MDSRIAGEKPSRLMESGGEWGFNTLSEDDTIRRHYTGGVSLGLQFADNTPFVGTSLRSGDKLVSGDYGGAAIDFVQGGLELYMIAYDQSSKIANAILQTFSKNVVTKKGIEVTEASIVKALEGSTMQTLQGKVSLPMVQRYVKMLESGSVAPPIKVANGIIVEGNYRYVAGRLFGVEPVQVPYVVSPSQMNRAVPIQKTVVDFLDWGGY
ncbi:hypothetical protein FAZ15_16080 [Sphingobacterium olei]|uniref:Uncharacterized protein n=1 Tax=Sphingobacterium olei TaxID=2571155 RepID=A0A4U0NIQ7_9SPHI|nr:hypothetical protein [Sphingobacterium olei]TJZ53562.1 hypothetical protein FAZ15_16080 [Sphingobacterium olei]